MSFVHSKHVYKSTIVLENSLMNTELRKCSLFQQNTKCHVSLRVEIEDAKTIFTKIFNSLYMRLFIS